MKTYHIRKVNEKFVDKTKGPIDVSTLKLIRIGLVDYVVSNGELIPAEEFFTIERRQK